MAGDGPTESLRSLYLEAARTDVANLERLILAVAEGRPGGRVALADMRRVTHDIMGQGAAFGYPLMTRVGRSLSRLLKSCEALDEACLDLARDHVVLLRAALEAPGGGLSSGKGARRAARLEQRVKSLTGGTSCL
jgi:chemotaxis protein histidine kinase CheA